MSVDGNELYRSAGADAYFGDPLGRRYIKTNINKPSFIVRTDPASSLGFKGRARSREAHTRKER
jgi:hypothetical protein